MRRLPRLRRRRLRIEPPLAPCERATLMVASARIGIGLGILLGAALLAWWFGDSWLWWVSRLADS
jgi:hypothetical protein